MIATCSNCRHTYWKYRGDWETPSFCSWPCRDFARAERLARAGDAGPGLPVAIAELIRSHYRIAHRTPDPFSGDWPMCAECERLEALHAEAIAWHLPELVGTVEATQ